MNHIIPRDLKVYVISLPEDQQRRDAMRRQFGVIYDEFEVVDGVRLSSRELLIEFYGQKKFDSALTIAELGCALTHLSVLEDFMRSDSTYALILEDDVIGNANDILEIASIIQNLPSDAFLLCGGQEGLRGQPYNYGVKTDIENVFLLPKIVRKFYTRACCYCVTKSSASHIVEQQRNNLSLSDNWDKYFKNQDDFFFTKKISHPTCLASSNIEQERAANIPRNELARVMRDGVLKTLSRFITKILVMRYHRLLGLSKVK